METLYQITIVEGLDINQYLWTESVCRYHFGVKWAWVVAGRIRGIFVECKGLR